MNSIATLQHCCAVAQLHSKSRIAASRLVAFVPCCNFMFFVLLFLVAGELYAALACFSYFFWEQLLCCNIKNCWGELTAAWGRLIWTGSEQTADTSLLAKLSIKFLALFDCENILLFAAIFMQLPRSWPGPRENSWLSSHTHTHTQILSHTVAHTICAINSKVWNANQSQFPKHVSSSILDSQTVGKTGKVFQLEQVYLF